ncbi:exodeoxyribonuclease V subunit beta [Pasteurellaceae bacterium 15-036681]|nr:exodeoxyribonuclease V subunit beta [Pasteurellaceae bacterium 15-036681]
MNTLDPISLPLNTSVLIEASAGTGKTYTMVNLYLRLLLGVGDNLSPKTTEQILVVTFTKAATQELRDRIREKLNNVAKWFQAYGKQDIATQAVESDPFLAKLYQAVKPNLAEALLRLRIAERDIDLASIFTIDSFCQKMLFQFAFDSGVRFDIDLQPDENELLTRLAEESWRELFYALDENQAMIIANELKNPSYALGAVKDYLYTKQPELGENKDWLTQSLSDYLTGLNKLLAESKDFWRAHRDEITSIIIQEVEKKYKTGEKKALSRRSYQMRWIEPWIAELDQWASNSANYFPTSSLSRFGQTMLIEKAEEGAEPLTNAYFQQIDDFIQHYQQQFEGKQKALLLYQFLTHLAQKLSQYKQNHKEKSFGDMLNFLHQALYAENGEALASRIRQLFPFAMIDEFQDTNLEQYEIFSRIFMGEHAQNQGFIMIGDPKQSIYKFRGADIFTYLEAANKVQYKATLERNWRSLPEVVDGANKLFDIPNPFLYQGIQFVPVSSKASNEKLIGAANNRFFLQNEFDEQLAAKQCAYQIQQQLKNAEQGQFYVQLETENRPLEAQDIAVLVRSHNQAKLIRQALQECHIQSVFFAERESVYDTQEAKDILLILKACLNPYHQGTLLATLGSQLWGLTASELHELKQDETKWDSTINRFAHYQFVWQQQGILPMLHQIFMHEEIIQRINTSENADRRITDLLHLAELLQGAMPNLENESALVRWYEQQLNSSNGQSGEQTLRLESEESLVKIITIHGSKGLEYPIVWLPFAAKPSTPAKSQAMVIYHDGEQSQWDFGSQSAEVKELINKAEFAEDLRLLYVAVTRTKYQLNLILPLQLGSKWNSVAYLLTNGEMSIDGSYKSALSTADYLKQKGLTEQIIELPDNWEPDDWQPAVKQQDDIKAQIFNEKINKKNGLITSFSSLTKDDKVQYNPSVFEDLAADYDQINEIDEISDSAEMDQQDSYNAYQFPRGKKVGNILHKFFELWDFNQPLERSKIAELCEQLGLDDNWVEPLITWFNTVAETPFADQKITLKQIDNKKCLNEWRFYLRLLNAKALIKFNQLLKEHSPLAKLLADIELPEELSGFIRGSVDAVIEMNGKFYILDYKSNFLGSYPEDYRQSKIAKAMGKSRYDLQYLFYTLAVHRYLKTRLQEKYDYERDFGGVAYLFLRGMNGTADSGVYFEKPSAVLIEEMDKLFG